jgi:phosphopantothenoylcysteine decarboxylase/phosphopantothenate--cysteine ligase
MGYMLAEVARNLGAEVTLISGPTDLTPPAVVDVVSVETAQEMRDAVHQYCEQATILVMNAAVADFRPEHFAEEKIKKQKQSGMDLHLVPNPDILGELAQRTDLFKVGFAAETHDILANAQAKLAQKGLHMIVANEAIASIGKEDIQITIIQPDMSVVYLERQPKYQAAAAIWEAVINAFTKNY